jgi:propanol-preferring alcohol dehydrogenase
MTAMRNTLAMFAMVLEAPRTPLVPRQVALTEPGRHQLLIQVRACGVCRTDLHIFDGELERPKLPLVLGHEIVGRIVEIGSDVSDWSVGDRVGVPWLGLTDGECRFCRGERENLCDSATFTGYTVDGGYAEYVVADARYCVRVPDRYSDVEAAPLLCAGLIGYRTYRLAGSNFENLGIYGFGAAAHIVAQIGVAEGRKVYAFTRPGDVDGQAFARRLGAVWAGGSNETPPVELDAALIFAPVGQLVVQALKATAKGGTVVSGGIHMSDIPAFPYRLLWEERVVRSVANLTRADAAGFMQVAAQTPIQTSVEVFALGDANVALDRLRGGGLRGAAVLVPPRSGNVPQRRGDRG